ncbi:MAG TPA: TIGR03619 family F420-dependent LLM class oxidoreductase [Gaiellaceae bacterium]|nr:TIGR03619 family F420-dependent LLM class oxidoreductase [Gaiellaceae bacterium]
MGVRLGAKVPNSGALPLERGIPALARALEEAGFDSLWVSDHVVLPERMESRYPFAADGRATWPPDTPYIDALIALALVAAATERASFGPAVLVLPQRNPVLAAKQLASLDAAGGGRLRLGVGAGWLREEFEALGAPFESRGARLEEWIGILRDCWTGAPPARSGGHYDLPAGLLCLPTPARRVPILVGGHSRAALRRAGELGDGWLGQQSLDELDPAELAAARAAMARAARDAGRDPDGLEVVLRVVGAAGRAGELARRLPELERAGVGEVIVDVDWEAGDPVAERERLAAAAA